MSDFAEKCYTFLETEVWITAKGEKIPIKILSERHIKNIINYVRKTTGSTHQPFKSVVKVLNNELEQRMSYQTLQENPTPMSNALPTPAPPVTLSDGVLAQSALSRASTCLEQIEREISSLILNVKSIQNALEEECLDDIYGVNFLKKKLIELQKRVKEQANSFQ